MTRDDVYAFLAATKLGVLSTAGQDGMPQSALMGIAVTAELEIVFGTVRISRKYPNLIENPTCSFVVGWGEEQTVQYEGVAEELAADNTNRYKQIYSGVFPDGVNRQSWPEIVYFVVRPYWVRFSDFGQEPPVIEEFEFARK